MSAFGYHDGQRQTARTVLSGSSATTLLDASTQAFDIVGIKLVNHSGGALTPVVDVYDGSTSFILRDDKSLADQADEQVDLPGGDDGFYKMKRGDKLRVTANSNLTVHVSYIIPYTATGPGHA